MLRIAEAREARGWTQDQLAQAIGTTQQTVQRWESGQVDPQVSKIEAISKVLGITMTFLLGVDSSGSDGDVLSANEREVVDIMRGMTPEGVHQLSVYARGLAQTYPKNNQVRGHKTA
ncbi:MAG: helix-turn-helix transcriptional regulator [Bacteroidales bacterium]|nr:helix-turn-helix transcriptional regulator [Bacteroidales bacterium]